MRKNLHDLTTFIRFVLTRFKQDHCGQAAASMTFTTLLALVPMLTIALTVFSAFPVFDDFSTQIKIYLLSNLMPDKAGVIISHYMQQFTESATRLTAVGITFLAITAMSMMLTIDKTFNVIWRVSTPRPLLKRLVVYWAVLTLAPLLIGASLSLTSWLVGLSMGYAKNIPLFGISVLSMLPTLFTTLAFTLLFKLVPNRYVPLAHAVIGALIAAILFEAMNRVFGSYVSHFPTYKLVYGAFASVPIFLMWIYLSWLIILCGAVIAASLSHWRMPDAQHQPPILKLLHALRLLRLLATGLECGQVTTHAQLSHRLGMGYDDIDHLLDKLQSAQLVCKAEAQGWLLLRDLDHIGVVELLQLFALERQALHTLPYDAPLRDWLDTHLQGLEQRVDISLKTLFATCDERLPT